MKKNVSKFRGSRTCGGGTHKNRRGGGSRGGHGKAGGCKHHFVRNYMRGLSYGKYGFKRPQKVLADRSIVNVGELDEMAQQLVADEVAHKKGDVFHINLAELEYPIDKVLGNGAITKPIVVTVSGCSTKARSKIEEAGGEVVILSDIEPEESGAPEEDTRADNVQ